MTARPFDVCDGKDTLPDDLTADRALLSTAVLKAGGLARRYFRGGAKTWQKGPGQIVTEADIAVDQQLHGDLIGARSSDGWLSEEREDDGSRHGRRRVWIIDPIDGTRSFAEGVAEFTISAALVIDGEPAVASVLNPITSEHFEAVKGRGALLNGEPLSPSPKPSLAGASLLASLGEMRRRRWPDVIPEARFTTIGSLAYKLSLVAAGRFAGLVSRRSSHDWDLAAAALILREAGAWLGNSRGEPLRLNQTVPKHRGLVAAGTEPLYNALVGRLEMIRSSEA